MTFWLEMEDFEKMLEYVKPVGSFTCYYEPGCGVECIFNQPEDEKKALQWYNQYV
jgi:hypothetical protein